MRTIPSPPKVGAKIGVLRGIGKRSNALRSTPESV